jgi:hypothetical protein
MNLDLLSSGALNVVDIIGKRFGRWTVISYAGKDKYHNKLVLVQCDCGTQKVHRLYNVEVGETHECITCARKKIKGRKNNYPKDRKRRC